MISAKALFVQERKKNPKCKERKREREKKEEKVEEEEDLLGAFKLDFSVFLEGLRYVHELIALVL